ncbi:metallophosphoesterase [Pararhizobium sp. BT-229]|uniref:metallophosphoesterase n=1 Tax=Pararhizobium sp. BT-229 TaxID=2986923 RepID=UPI0021F73D04|nr:metallophosphoesterase [Pararhizobium sp. BT-229]MCV9966567.1 metallophosphoesterase [Pararhizobium sp. BT-229]
MGHHTGFLLSRRRLLAGLGSLGVLASIRPAAFSAAASQSSWPPIDATFIFAADVHACLVSADTLSPHCEEEGKTDANLLRHVSALNRITDYRWPVDIGGTATGLSGAGERIATPFGIVIGGDMTDDGGGQVKVPGEGHQLMQFSSRYQQGTGPDRVHYPVYNGLGNHDLDQDGAPPHIDWYRRELRDYVELNHRQTVFYKPPVAVGNYDIESDNYSWDWGGLHLVQLQRFGGDTGKGAISGLDWLKQDLANSAADGRPVVLFQHYGWDRFSLESWDPATMTFDDEGAGHPHWWSDDDRAALLSVLKGYNVVGLFHGHEHDTPMIYRQEGLDLFKPVATFMGGFALARITSDYMDVVLARTEAGSSDVTFTNAFSKRLV